MSEFVYVKAPELCQGSDEKIIVEISSTVFKGFVDRPKEENGLRLCVPGDYKSLEPIEDATNKFQILLGGLRAWRHIAGERRDEVRPGIGPGTIRDEKGNQVIRVGSAIEYVSSGNEIKEYAENLKVAVENSPSLRNAIWLNGRRERNAADFYMIYEYAESDFKGRDNISKELELSKSEIKKLCQSINNLCPTKGGRHIAGTSEPHMDLEEQRKFTANLLKKWITYVADNHKNT